MWGWNKNGGLQRFLEDFERGNGESTGAGVGEGTEVIVTEKGEANTMT